MNADLIGLFLLITCVFFFLASRISSAAVGTIGCILAVLLGVCSFDEAFSGFSSSIVLLMASSMIVGIAMFNTGAAQIIGRRVIAWSKGSEKLFLVVSCFVAGVMSMFLANTATLAAFIAIVDSVCSQSKMKRKNLVLPLSCAVMVGGCCTLIGCTPQLTANALLVKLAGLEMGMWTLTGPGLVLFGLFILYLVIFGTRHSEKIWGDRPEEKMAIDEEKIRAVLDAEYDRKKLFIMFTILILMVISYAFSILPTHLTAMCAASLCILSGCCSVENIVKELNWEAVIFLASCLGLANAITIAGTGELISRAIITVIGEGTSSYVVFVLLVTLSLFISQFITNSTAIIIILPVAISYCSAVGISAMPYCIGITFGASVACCTPLAAAQIAMTQVAGYRFSDYLKYGWLLSLILLAGILVGVPLFYPLT